VPTGADLAEHRILVVEDNFLLAMEIEGLLRRQGCVVLGPVGTVEHALALLDREATPDLAVLDVDLQGRRVTPVAAALLSRDVPFVLVTGYRELQLDEPELDGRPRLEKPLDSQSLLRTMARLLERS
jgi:two-component SAPR family response regulator